MPVRRRAGRTASGGPEEVCRELPGVLHGGQKKKIENMKKACNKITCLCINYRKGVIQ